MSKIGRMPINLNNVSVDIKGNSVHYKGKQSSGVYELPENMKIEVTDGRLWLKPGEDQKKTRDFNRIWGMHRALLSNAIVGSDTGFTKEVIIKGLGYKAVLSGSKITFTLGYSHKIDFSLPKEVSLQVDKTGQKLTFSSFDKQKLGQVCSLVKALKKTEPYKQTGIRLSTDRVIQKAGKTKA
ncbi:MAG: 50S ribosomal protein L6 [Candidatus Dependentiae bacterium]